MTNSDYNTEECNAVKQLSFTTNPDTKEECPQEQNNESKYWIRCGRAMKVRDFLFKMIFVLTHFLGKVDR